MPLLVSVLALPAMLEAQTAPAAGSKSAASSPAPLAPLIPANRANDVLFWSPERRLAAFSAMETVVATRIIAAGTAPRALEQGPPLVFGDELTGFAGRDFNAFMIQQNMAAVLVIHNGRVRLERYAPGYGPETRWSTFSVAKSITSTLVGAALRDGAIKSLDDRVTQYLPALSGSAYDDVTVGQLLTMTSGVAWSENYTSRSSDVARFLTLKPLAGRDVAVEYMRGLKREVPPGTRFRYNTGETTLTGLVVANATGKPLADYLSEKIWKPAGMERDAIWALDENGREIGGCCISATARDLARFGRFMLEDGSANGDRKLPDNWVRDSTRWISTVDPKGLGYGYQWWVYRYGGYEAKGIFGQSVYIDKPRNLVVVTLAAWPSIDGGKGRPLAQLRWLGAVQSAILREEAGISTPDLNFTP